MSATAKKSKKTTKQSPEIADLLRDMNITDRRVRHRDRLLDNLRKEYDPGQRTIMR